jgi:hypothetical protein
MFPFPAFDYRTAPVASQILPTNNDGIKVLQTSWHPFSSSHFGVLTSDAVFRYAKMDFGATWKS